MAISFKGAHCPPDLLLMGIRWSVAYPLSTRHVEALMLARGVHVAHSTLNRCVVTYSPRLAEAFHRRQRSVWVSWHLDETYMRGQGQWSYLYRAVDQPGPTRDLLRTAPRDTEAARKFRQQAIRRHGLPETITIDGSDAHDAAIQRSNAAHGMASAIRQGQYWHNVVEQDHRAVKGVTRPMLGGKSVEAAQDTRVGIERMPMRKTRQLRGEARDEGLSAAD